MMFRRGGFRRWVVLLIAMAVASAMVGTPVQAKGLKERLQKLGKKKDEAPVVGVSGPPTTAPDSRVGRGQRKVLLVTEPRHDAEIADGSTLAFIAFNHIEHDFPDFMRVQTSEEIRETTTYGERIEYRVGDSVYNAQVCARQVASALAQHLADLNRFKVVTRDHIASVLDEQKFIYSGAANTRDVAKLGELIGADVLIYGEVQLCVSSRMDNEALVAAAALGAGVPDGGKGGFVKGIIDGFRTLKSEKLRSFVLAQIQLIEAETGRRVFTTSLQGLFEGSSNAFQFDMNHRELVYWAADDLANGFIDNLLSRQEARYIPLHSDAGWGFDKGIDLVQLGQCRRAERHFSDVYRRHGGQMDEMDIARLMYNHGVALMCSNQPTAALDRLWASLRLTNDAATFEAIAFTNDTVDRGRAVLAEDDTMIEDVARRRFPEEFPAVAAPPPPGSH